MNSLRKVRLISQIGFIVFILLTIFAINRHPVAYKIAADWYLRLNPLSGLLASIASRTVVIDVLLVSFITLVLTILFGRVFCGFFCPLGALIDFSDKYLFRKKPPGERRPGAALQKLKYLFLIAVMVLAFFKVFFPLFTDPLSFFTRAVTLLLYPILWIIGLDGMELLRPVIEFMGAEDLLLTSARVPLFYGTLGVTVLLALVLIGCFWDRRFWCQYVCPTGALLGILSRFAIFRRRVSCRDCDFCKKGRTCAKVCPTRAIDDKDITVTSAAECVVCGVCTDIKDSCSAFGFGKAAYQETLGADIRRRQVVAGAAAGICCLPMFRGNALNKHEESGRLIRPPGSVPEEQFTGQCIGCGECAKVCPTNCIQLCSFEDGINKLYTPKIVPRIGGCEEKCYVCGHVCPTGAIRELVYEEKRFVKIGTAVINKDKCLPWEQTKECLVCDEVCPYNAITTKLMDTPYGPYKVPVVDEDLCLGCGLCEEHCPIFDEAAIVVFKFSENRRASGPYLSESKKKQVLEQRRKSDRSIGKVLKPGADSTGAGKLPEGFILDEEQGGSKLPEGFIMDNEKQDKGDQALPEGFIFD
ncbi:4Fe-4S binding protein [Fibrobacterota bacterium]